MDTEILIELYNLNSKIDRVIWLFIGVFVVLIVQVAFRLHDGWKVRSNDVFRNKMENFYNSGDFSVVVTGCDLKLSKHPNDSWSYWWKGKAHYKLGEYNESEEAFNKLALIDPSWYRNVTPWIEHIRTITHPENSTETESQPQDQGNSPSTGPVV
ncbi:MAG: tetratricopeptide repeat protein [Verrucomicrobia bacterium]|nr:tetratricopeptide repeat protein [Verrucomicrobiota bacterium]MCH8527083.1 tetratricopeptide repeat protein [Kiritimatiellia bacterium]